VCTGVPGVPVRSVLGVPVYLIGVPVGTRNYLSLQYLPVGTYYQYQIPVLLGYSGFNWALATRIYSKPRAVCGWQKKQLRKTLPYQVYTILSTYTGGVYAYII
jgi:hypothetical protein